MTNSRVFAIHTGDYVEFRIASTPPRAKISKLIKDATVIEHNIEYLAKPPYIKRYPHKVHVKVTLKQTFYIGGRVLGVCKSGKFKSLFLIDAPKKDKMLELTGNALDLVLKKRNWL